jgi:hypothetical protein
MIDEDIIKYCIIPYLDKISDLENVISLLSNKDNIRINLVDDWPKKPFYPINTMVLKSMTLEDHMLKYITKIHTLIVIGKRRNIFSDPELTDNALYYLKGINTLVLNYETSITDAGLEYLTGIDTLIIGSNCITNIGLKHISSASTLSIIYNNNIGNDGLKYLTNIKNLLLSSNYVDDDGLQLIPNIENLVLYNKCQITLSGVKYLKNIKMLELHNFSQNLNASNIRVVKIDICDGLSSSFSAACDRFMDKILKT